MEIDEIAPELVINCDQTGIYYVLAASWTMEKEGSKRIEIYEKISLYNTSSKCMYRDTHNPSCIFTR